MALGTYQDDVLDPSMDGKRQYTMIHNGNDTYSFVDDTVYTQVGTDFGAADINAIIDAMYPVGSIYLSVNNVSPATFFGGTWERITDTFLLCAGSTYTAGSAGGAATDTITTGGTVGGHSLTESEMPSHHHMLFGNDRDDATAVTASTYAARWSQYTDYEYSIRASSSNDATRGKSGSAGSGNSHTHGFTGANVTVDTMPPYLAVYAWKRTA